MRSGFRIWLRFGVDLFVALLAKSFCKKHPEDYGMLCTECGYWFFAAEPKYRTEEHVKDRLGTYGYHCPCLKGDNHIMVQRKDVGPQWRGDTPQAQSSRVIQ